MHSLFLFVSAGVRKCFTQARVRALHSAAVRGNGYRGAPRKKGSTLDFLSALTETQLPIYEVSVSHAGHGLPERPASEEEEGGKSQEFRQDSHVSP